MSNTEDVRWIQRFSNYNRALDKLNNIIDYIKEQEADDETEEILNDIMSQALIQSFEYTHELAWNVMNDYAKYQGNSSIGGSRDATREALQLQIIDDGEIWMEMIKSRNKTSYTYNESVANNIFQKIIHQYQALFNRFRITMEEKRAGSQLDLL